MTPRTSKRNNNIALIDEHEYEKDNRPKYHCQGCGGITKKDIEADGDFEITRCSECGFSKSFAVS